MDPQRLYALWEARNYVLIAAFVIGFLVRLLKSDTKIPIDIPPRLRLPLAFAFGAIGGVLETIASGKPWRQAVFEGAVAAALAVLGQNVFIDSIRGGKELPIPGLMLEGEPPSPGKPPTIPPPGDPGANAPPPLPPLAVLIVVVGFFFPAIVGCWHKVATVLEIAAEKAACVVANQDLPNEVIFLKCAVQPGDVEKYSDLLAKARESTNKALERAAAPTRVGADGGCP